MAEEIIKLDNGLRIIHQRIKFSKIVHCGFIIDAGARDENKRNNGIAHFIEHSVFKGTKKRKAYHILNRIETVGGDLNAYTSREKTCFYTASLKRYADRAIELLTDITFNPVFPEKEVEKEKQVIVEEIEMYEDSPEESIYDEFFELMFPGHPLGFNILGTRNNVKKFNRKKILDFIKEKYSNNRIVLSVVGNITPGRLEQIVQRYLSNIELKEQVTQRPSPEEYVPFSKVKKKDFQQYYCIIGNRAYSNNEDKRYAFSLLNNILGGDGMSSRLSLGIREKYGYVYNIGSNYSLYTDTGVFTIELSTDKNHLEKCLDLVYKELKKLKTQKLGKLQLNKAKKQLLGQAAMLQENHSVMMQMRGRSLLDYGRIISLDEFFHNIETVTSEDILEVANEILDETKLSKLIYEPTE